MGCRLGIDVGGTFTDLLLLDDRSGEIRLLKAPNAAGDAAGAIPEGLHRLIREAGIAAGSIEQVRCATSLPRRLLQTRGGSRLGMLVTAGFEYVLHLARGRTPAPLGGWMDMAPAEPLADLALTRGVPERIGAQGDVVVQLDEGATIAAIRELIAAGVETVVVSLLHAPANPAHEQRVGALVRELAPGLPVLLAGAETAVAGEYERTLLAALNGYLQSPVAAHLERLAEQLRNAQVAATLGVVRSDAGTLPPRRAAAQAAQTMRAGPAGGAVAAALLAAQAGHRQAVGLDMGGGGTDLCLIREGQPAIAGQARIGGLSVQAPAIDIHSLGLGGAAVAHVDERGDLRIGPRSASAGPACFGRGGSEPTLSDANLVLGRLPPRLGETILSSAAAEGAIGGLAQRLGLDLHAAAQAVVALAEETLAGGLRLLAARHGARAEELALVAFGGAGPLHGNAAAALTGSWPVLVPPLPGGMSALGFVCAAPREEAGIAVVRRLEALAPGELGASLGRLREAVGERLLEAGAARGEQTIRCEAALRYAPDGAVLPVAFDGARPGEDDAAGLAARFAAQHERLLGFRLDAPVEMVALRAVGTGRPPAPPPARLERGGADPSAAAAGQQRMHVGGAFVTATVFARDRLRAGNRIAGPALVVQPDACALVLPGHVGEVHGHGCLLIQPEGGR